ncbi:MAG: phosphoglucosamine mutase [Nanoarchaeota archaeon]|nr:phosphoglucosamine mutase [Nanoarchaeota archaeon]
MENIFRAYDIRGIIDKEITEETIEKIGKAFGTFLNGKGTVVVARDTRRKGEIFKEKLTEGITSTGVNVIDIGMQCTPVLNFYCSLIKSTAGAQITASHNPPEYSGVRFRKSDGTGFPEAVPNVRELFFSEKFIKGNGKVQKVDEKIPQEEYINFVLSKIKIEKPISVVLDPGNGATSNFAKKLFEKAGCEVIAINDEPSSEFPGRGPNPKPKMLFDLGQEVRINNADIGIAFDGDGDRVAIVDDEGEVLSADEIGCIIVKEILSSKKGKIVINVECSKAVEDTINENGGEVIYTRVGDAFLAGAIKENNAIFGMEASNHFTIPGIFPFDDGVLVGLFFTKIMSEKDIPLSELRKKIPRYPKESIKIECEDDLKFKVIQNLKEKLKAEHKIIDIDGIRINFANGWILIRASNTTPFIRLTVEAKTEKETKLLLDKFKAIVEDEIEKVKKND